MILDNNAMSLNENFNDDLSNDLNNDIICNNHG